MHFLFSSVNRSSLLTTLPTEVTKDSERNSHVEIKSTIVTAIISSMVTYVSGALKKAAQFFNFCQVPIYLKFPGIKKLIGVVKTGIIELCQDLQFLSIVTGLYLVHLAKMIKLAVW